MKKCPGCGDTKELVEFSKDRRTKSGYNCYCKTCTRIKSAKRREAQPNISRKCHLKRRYNLSLEDYNKMAELQNGMCAICGKKPEKLVVDHCHKSGNVRKLLCHPCNLGLGKFFDNISYLQNAITYLNENHH